MPKKALQTDALIAYFDKSVKQSDWFAAMRAAKVSGSVKMACIVHDASLKKDDRCFFIRSLSVHLSDDLPLPGDDLPPPGDDLPLPNERFLPPNERLPPPNERLLSPNAHRAYP
ncbi:hypothetical protein [Alloprevotella tannerae]|uniref:hypothetical protein n=1 Tax=Alloprevotella tannerae TaxID=76122 RepID=UPI0028E840D8|nr:hypothetical protein [Alloprevotella tannerae]